MDWESIGKRIRSQREYLGYTRENFAEKIDVTPKFCSDIELELKGMSVQTLCRISDVLNISVDYILFGACDNNDNQCCSTYDFHIFSPLVIGCFGRVVIYSYK